MIRKFIALILAACVSTGAYSQTADHADIVADYTDAPGDTISLAEAIAIESEIKADPYTRFRPTQLILPGTLIAVGSWGVCNGWFNGIKHDIKNEMTHMRDGHYIHVDDYIQYLPGAGYLALGSLGVKSRLRFKERLVVAATSAIALTVLTNGIKYTVGEKRPDSSARNSFPSGHTATVFMGAELIRMEYSLGVAIGAYGVAFGTAFLRLYNERHWLNDVIAGAGIGILSARIGYWLLPFNRRLFRISPHSKVIMTALPSYDPYNRSVGLAFNATF